MTNTKEAKDMVMGKAEVEEAVTTNTTKEKEVMFFEEIVKEAKETMQNPAEGKGMTNLKPNAIIAINLVIMPRNVDMVLIIIMRRLIMSRTRMRRPHYY